MKKIIKLFFSLLMLSSCQNATVIQRNNLSIVSATSCSDGELTLKQSGVNVLPSTYAGNYPDTGVYEIGGTAGGSLSTNCPSFDFGMTISQAITVAVAFENDPSTFGKNFEKEALGYEIVKLDKNNNRITKKIYLPVSSIDEWFTETGDDYAKSTSDSTTFFTDFFLYHPAKALCLGIFINSGEKLVSVKIDYGDCPQKVINASIFLQSSNLKNDILAKWTGDDCTIDQYTKELGSHLTYNMLSPYGSHYSENFLLNSFVVKDYSVSRTYRPKSISDPDGYFTKAQTSPVGTCFTVTIVIVDSSLNQGDITFNFTVSDMQGPKVTPLFEDCVKTSYQSLKNNKFYSTYFTVHDNVDGNDCTLSLTDSQGGNISFDKIGKKDALLIAKDKTGNVTKYPFSLELIDDVAPIIECQQDEIVLNTLNYLSADSLLSMFSATDEIDGKCQLSVAENTYSSNSNVVGNYIFRVEAMDKSGNIATRSISLTVGNDKSPVFYTKENTITFIEGNTPSMDEVTSSLIKNGMLPDKHYINVTVIEGTPLSSSLKEGTYEATLYFQADDDTSSMLDVLICVLNQNDSMLKSDSSQMTWWDHFCQFWVDLWNSIVSIFSPQKK